MGLRDSRRPFEIRLTRVMRGLHRRFGINRESWRLGRLSILDPAVGSPTLSRWNLTIKLRKDGHPVQMLMKGGLLGRGRVALLGSQRFNGIYRSRTAGRQIARERR